VGQSILYVAYMAGYEDYAPLFVYGLTERLFMIEEKLVLVITFGIV